MEYEGQRNNITWICSINVAFDLIGCFPAVWLRHVGSFLIDFEANFGYTDPKLRTVR